MENHGIINLKNKPWKNHGKENYEKLNEHGNSKEKQGIIMKLKNNKIIPKTPIS